MLKSIGIFFFVVIYYSAKSQYFLRDGQPCPLGKKVTLDTIFYTPDEPMPFDRCFVLKVTQAATVKIKYFSIIPIDRYGIKKVRRRDYRAFIKSGWPRDRKRAKNEAMTYGQFKDTSNKLIYLFKGIKSFPSGKNLDYYLNVPPLDPNREYQLIIVYENEDQVGKFTDFAKRVFETPIGQTLPLTKFNDLKTEFNQQLALNERKPISFRPYNFFDYFSELDTCSNMIYIPENLEAKSNKKLFEKNKNKSLEFKTCYKFFLVPDGIAFTDNNISRLPPDRFLEYCSEQSPKKISLSLILADMQLLKIKDVSGNAIDFFSAKHYDLFIAVYDNIKIGDEPFQSEKTHLEKISDISISNNPAKDMVLFNHIPIRTVAKDCENKYRLQIHNQVKIENDLQSLIDSRFKCILPSQIHFLMEIATECPCEEKGVKDLTEKNDLLKTIATLYNFNVWAAKIFSGTTSFGDPYTDVKPDNLEGRLTNIKVSIEKIHDVNLFVAKAAAMKNSRGLGFLLNCLKRLEDKLEASSKIIVKLKEVKKTRSASVSSDFDILAAQQVSSGSSEILDLMGSAKFRIIPDFGFIGVMKGEKLGFKDLTPYLGFHINFRSIDKNIPMRRVLYKSLWYRLSFMSGITLRSLKIEGKREDFFGSNNLITGLGFRLNNYIRITGGTIWFRSIDKNPLSTDKPLAFSPFAGISLDLELQELFGGFKNLIK